MSILKLITILVTVCVQSCPKGQLVDYFSGTSVSTNKPNSSWPHIQINDGDFATFYTSGYPYDLGDYLELDMVSSVTIKTIGMTQRITGHDSTINIYIGDTPATGTYKTDNTLCYTGFR